jgi:hypothetical protein
MHCATALDGVLEGDMELRLGRASPGLVGYSEKAVV